ncbi:unnamed protein product [Meganyctiphanes norvegica]|uniref:Endonuclease/exonuclease/phosphatase domain-containing protein n=1 Tax=Meganyctiphanes norvegica TaxID=48144 RepID=A0AAV2S5T8_MEGNR
MEESNEKIQVSCSICDNADNITKSEHSLSSEDQPLRIVSVNVNLMPSGALSFLTSGTPEQRASQLADFLLQNHGMHTDIFYIQELYHVNASNVFKSKLDEAEFQPFEGPKAGIYNGLEYKYNSGQVIFMNKKRLKIDLHSQNNMPNVDEETVPSEDQKSTQTVKYTVTHLDSLAFPSYGIHGKGPLEKCVPKGAIWLRLNVKNINDNSEMEQQILDTYYLHLQSDPLALLYNFNPKQVRTDQIKPLKDYSVFNTKNVKIPHHNLFIGDFNIASNWNEFTSLNEFLNVAPVNDTKCVTIGCPSNTSHNPLVWKIGGILYDHYEAQLDHCLVSSSLKSNSVLKSSLEFGTFPLSTTKENRRVGGTPREEKSSLTDHEGIFVELNF